MTAEKNIFFTTRSLLTVMLVMLVNFSFAQKNKDGGIKKSTKTEIIDGKKYYLHTVEKGQTLYAIAKTYDLTVNDVLVENPDALNGIKPGQVLRIPAQKQVVNTTKPPAADTGFFIHKVEAGQTLYSIALKYNISQDEILKLNPDAKNGLRIGEELKIPSKSGNSVAISNVVNSNVGSDTSFTLKKKDAYQVAMMLPFQGWNADNLDVDAITNGQKDFPPKALAAVQFYEGALLALDSMKKTGMIIDLHVYDVDDADSEKVKTILGRSEFSGMDLIIGPLSPASFFPVSQWAKEHHVAIVSPVSPANRVIFHQPEAIKTLPSISTQMEQLAVYIAANNKTDNIILFNSGIPKEAAAGNAFYSMANKLLFPDEKDSVRIAKGFAALQGMMKKDKMNVIVITSNNQAYVTDLVRLINGLADDYPIMLFGTSTWMTFDNMDPEYLEKLQFHYAAPYFVDYDSNMVVKKFIASYESCFHSDPAPYAYAGYDVTLFFLHSLYTYGTDFYAKAPELKGSGIQQDFSFYRSDPESGYENKGVRIVKVSEYRLHRIQ
ncbi:MAG: LysM peptidoglycan-binding domain-containing protein [Bacteroidetes bacterium]|nr:LysM peptidoglycan-binding domain-containing protein [Bacteroidota bacterium]